jgi:hypothetical protein
MKIMYMEFHLMMESLDKLLFLVKRLNMKKLFSILTFAILFLATTHAQQIYLGPPIGSIQPQVYGTLGPDNGGTGSMPTCGTPGVSALYWVTTPSPHFACNSLGGTVTSVSPSGTNSMFALNIANQSTTPEISITLSDIINQVFIGTGAGTGSWATIPNCDGGTNALTFDNLTQSFGCNASGSGGTTTNSLTANSSGGAAAGTTFNGSSAVTYDYHSFGAPSATGSGASGTWAINISGSAAAVANSITFNDGGLGASSPLIYTGAVTSTVSYNTIGAPSVTGTGASGSWSINAATATALASSPTTCSLGQWATGISTNGNAICGSSNVTITLDSGSPIDTCGTTHTQALVGVRSTSAFESGFGSDPKAVIGWGSSGGLVVVIWPDVDDNVFDWAVCNQSGTAITPGAMTLNVGVK